MQKQNLISRCCIRLIFSICILFAFDTSSVAAKSVTQALLSELLKSFVSEGVKFSVDKIGSAITTETNGPTPRGRLDVMEHMVPGFRQASEELAECASDAQDARVMGVVLANKVHHALNHIGITMGAALACWDCVGANLLATDVSTYSDPVAVRLAMRSLLWGRRPSGEKIPYFSTHPARRHTRNTIARVLEDALKQVRGNGTVNKDKFEETIIDASVQSAITASRLRRRMKSASLDEFGRTLIFEIAGDNRFPFVEFDIGFYSMRLKHLLAFSSVGGGSISALLSPSDSSDEAKKARREKSSELMEECNNLSPSPTFHILPDRPPQCGRGMSRDDMKIVNKEFLLARIKDSYCPS